MSFALYPVQKAHEKAYYYHYDSKGGWIEVHENDLLEVGIDLGAISKKSYHNPHGRLVYLSPNHDIALFYFTFKAKYNKEPKVYLFDNGKYSAVRRFDAFNAHNLLTV